MSTMAPDITHYETEALDYYRHVSNRMMVKELEAKKQEATSLNRGKRTK